MPRSPRADEAGGLYHALNRGNLRAEIFKKQEDYVAFEKILAECARDPSGATVWLSADAQSLPPRFAPPGRW